MVKLKNKYIGDRAFYKNVLSVAVPIMIQNGITNVVSMLDNIMVGRLGTEAMSGVSIVNQFIFIFYLCVFGAISGAGIFTAQYYGLKDEEGIRHTMRFKLMIVTVATSLGILVFALLDDEIVTLFLHESESSGDLALTLEYGKEYLFVMLFGLLPFAFANAYASTMRETGEVVMPMVASLVAVGTNFMLNLLLIFGLLGFPALGIVGAAIATVISRFVECAVLIVYAHVRRDRFSYVKGLYRSFKMPRSLFTRITVKGIPLMLNELFGGSASSKLFLNVRERMSLCYYCSSSFSTYSGIMTVSSGIEVKNFEAVRAAVIDQLEQIKKGNISESELYAAKRSIENAYRQLYDSPFDLQSFYSGRMLFGITDTIEDCREKLMSVSLEQIVALANKVTLDALFFVEGTSCGETDEEDDDE